MMLRVLAQMMLKRQNEAKQVVMIGNNNNNNNNNQEYAYHGKKTGIKARAEVGSAQRHGRPLVLFQSN